MKANELSKTWLYIFIVTTIAAIAVFVSACVKGDVVIMTGTGLVAGAQIINIIRWFQQHSKKK